MWFVAAFKNDVRQGFFLRLSAMLWFTNYVFTKAIMCILFSWGVKAMSLARQRQLLHLK